MSQDAARPGSIINGQTPSVGRIVHYHSYFSPRGEYEPTPRAAVIAEVHEGGECSIVVFNPAGLFFNRAKFAEMPTPGCWNWPPISGRR